MDRQVVRGGFAGRSEKRNGGGHVGRVPADDRGISDTDLMDAIIIEASGAGFDVDIPDPASAARMRDSLEEWDNQGGAVEKPLRRETQGRSGDDADGGGGQKRPRTGIATKDRNELLQRGSSEPVSSSTTSLLRISSPPGAQVC